MRKIWVFILIMAISLYATGALGKEIAWRRQYLGDKLNTSQNAQYVPLMGQVKAPNLSQRDAIKNDENNDISLKILVPNPKWIVPARKSQHTEPITIGIRVNNYTDTSLKFEFCCTLKLNLISSQGEMLKQHRLVTFGEEDFNSDPVYIVPAKATRDFFFDAELFWQEEELYLSGKYASYVDWWFLGIKPDTYKIQFAYYRAGSKSPDKTSLDSNIKYWYGAIASNIETIEIIEQ